MKKLFCILIIGMFLTVTVGCATNAGQGAGLGAGAGGLASLIAGKKGSTAAPLIMGGALLGGAIGTAMDQQAKQASLNNPNKTVMVIEEEPLEETNCRKVVKRKWKNGRMIGEQTEETCTGTRTSNTYE